ncbi:MAG: DUF962 domain-containing protein [Planctomycetota bacterium]
MPATAESDANPPRTFAAFYPKYLADHTKPITKVFHIAGTISFAGFVVAAIILSNPGLVLAGVVSCYAAAWLSHVALERNRPASFRHPLYSILGDFKMTADVLTGRVPLDGR